MEQFEDDDVGYQRWLDRNPKGYVLSYDQLSRYDFQLHRATCALISGKPKRGERWTDEYGKACSTYRAELEDYARLCGGEVVMCAQCRPRSY
jgi:hypothetical protein